MTVLLHFKPTARYLKRKRMAKFQLEVLPTARNHCPQDALKVSYYFPEIMSLQSISIFRKELTKIEFPFTFVISPRKHLLLLKLLPHSKSNATDL